MLDLYVQEYEYGGGICYTTCSSLFTVFHWAVSSVARIFVNVILIFVILEMFEPRVFDLLPLLYIASVILVKSVLAYREKQVDAMRQNPSYSNPLAAQKGKYFYVGSFFSTRYSVILVLLYLIEGGLAGSLIFKFDQRNLMKVVWITALCQASISFILEFARLLWLNPRCNRYKQTRRSFLKYQIMAPDLISTPLLNGDEYYEIPPLKMRAEMSKRMKLGGLQERVEIEAKLLDDDEVIQILK